MLLINRTWLAALTVILTLGTDRCFGDEFQFRDAERPIFENRLSVDELSNARDVVLLDVRLAEDFALDPQLIPGALRRDPDLISEWVSDLPQDKRIVTYCVRGKWVSQKAATYLEEQGFTVQSLEGGIEAWKASKDDEGDSSK